MVKKIRSDKLKNLAKVSEVLVENPHATIKEISSKTDLSIWAVHSSKKEVEKSWNKDETISIIVNDAKNRIKMAGKIFDAHSQDIYNKYYDENWVRKEGTEPNKEDIKLLKEYVKDDLQRVTVFGWQITDEWGWLKEISTILDDIIS